MLEGERLKRTHTTFVAERLSCRKQAQPVGLSLHSYSYAQLRVHGTRRRWWGRGGGGDKELKGGDDKELKGGGDKELKVGVTRR